MTLPQPQLGRVLDRDDAFPGGNAPGEGVEHRRLPRPGAARHDHIAPPAHTAFEKHRHRPAHRAALHQRGQVRLLRRETADGEHGPVQCDRRQHHIGARTVGETRIDHRRTLVHPPPRRGDDAIDDRQQGVATAENAIRAFEPPGPFDVDAPRPVDQDLGHAGIVHQGLQRTEAHRLRHHGRDQRLGAGAVRQLEMSTREDLAGRLGRDGPQLRGIEPAQFGAAHEIEMLDHRGMEFPAHRHAVRRIVPGPVFMRHAPDRRIPRHACLPRVTHVAIAPRAPWRAPSRAPAARRPRAAPHRPAFSHAP